MNRTDVTGWSSMLIAVAMAGMSVVVVACSVFESSDREEEPQQLVGEPPADDDPFTYTGRPEQASKVGTSGRLEGGSPDAGGAMSDAGTSSKQGPQTDNSGVASQEPEASRSSTDMPEPPPAKKAAEPSDHRCFSCVRLCPAGDSSCEPGGQDMICGWGVHADKGAAESLARAECNGALERERGRERWDEITGECPPADCREPAGE